jgi:DNA-directed RNA polymerase specialized sigma24 family protein
MYKDDMICDGIENCIQYIDNFDPEKSKNPFAYFTQIVYFAFLRRIHKEKRQLDIKDKIIEKSGYNQLFTSDDGAGFSDYNGIKSRIETANRY